MLIQYIDLFMTAEIKVPPPLSTFTVLGTLHSGHGWFIYGNNHFPTPLCSYITRYNLLFCNPFV